MQLVWSYVQTTQALPVQRPSSGSLRAVLMPYLSACVLVYLELNQRANEFIRVYNANTCILSKVDKLSAHPPHRQPPILRYCDFSFGFDFTGTATGAT